jgi:Flp pilus assembly protein CpaB
MRTRTFLLFILVLIVAAVAVVLLFVFGNLGELIGIGDNEQEATPQVVEDDGPAEEPELPPPTPTTPPLSTVVVARIDIPVGTTITAELLETELRPDDNIAVQAGYVFNDVEDVVGRIARTNIDRSQEILDSMVALTPTDLLSMGSDVSLYLNTGNVAIAFPINRYSGVAYAMRPGDRIDVLISIPFVKIDPEFQTALPNLDWRINDTALAEGNSFLFEPFAQGRLELVEGLDIVGTIGPSGQDAWNPENGDLLQIPRRATQLTVQQATVVWVGTWEDPLKLQAEQQKREQEAATAGVPIPTPIPILERREQNPDLVILSMTAQDTLVLKYALDRGLDIDLALRAQGDSSVFITAAVSLPQLVEQAGFTIPDRGEFDADPRADDVPPPSIGPNPPE